MKQWGYGDGYRYPHDEAGHADMARPTCPMSSSAGATTSRPARGSRRPSASGCDAFAGQHRASRRMETNRGEPSSGSRARDEQGLDTSRRAFDANVHEPRSMKRFADLLDRAEREHALPSRSHRCAFDPLLPALASIRGQGRRSEQQHAVGCEG